MAIVIWSDHATWRFVERGMRVEELGPVTRLIEDAIDSDRIERDNGGRFYVLDGLIRYVCGWRLGGRSAVVVTVLTPIDA